MRHHFNRASIFQKSILSAAFIAVSVFSAGPKVLFIGNSFTYYNFGDGGIPVPFNLISSSLGDSITAEKITQGGVTLDWHWNNTPTRDKLNEGGWEWVVLQEYSNGTMTNFAGFQQSVANFDGAIKGLGAKTMLFQTWSYISEPLGMIDDIASACISEAYKRDIALSPVGWAFQRVSDETDWEMYWDDKHPRPSGTYLAACVFYAAMRNISPVGAAYPAEITDDDALYLQTVAWETWQHFSLRPFNTSAAPAIRIEGEYFTELSGWASGIAADEGDGRYMGHALAGDWMTYYVTADQAGEVPLTLRISSQDSPGQLKILSGAGGENTSEIEIPMTGDVQNWQNVETAVMLDAGLNQITLEVVQGDFNINWFEFGAETGVAQADSPLQKTSGLSYDRAMSIRYNGRNYNISGKSLRVEWQRGN